MIKYRKEGNIMGSVQNISKCPRCGKETYFSDYYYRTGESYEFCTCCGKNRSISFYHYSVISSGGGIRTPRSSDYETDELTTSLLRNI